MKNAFEYPEDRKFFVDLLCDAGESFSSYTLLFDTTTVPAIKRLQFQKIVKAVRKDLIQRYGKICMLRLSDQCDIEDGMNVDHLIPLSSNKLNKELRNIRAAKGKKVPTQSFGANHPSNLILACAKCNGKKKHQFLKREQIKKILDLKAGR